MLVLEDEHPELYTRLQEKNLARQYDLLTTFIEIGLQQGPRAFDKYVAALRASDRAWDQGNLDLTEMEAYLAGLMADQLREAQEGDGAGVE